MKPTLGGGGDAENDNHYKKAPNLKSTGETRSGECGENDNRYKKKPNPKSTQPKPHPRSVKPIQETPAIGVSRAFEAIVKLDETESEGVWGNGGGPEMITVIKRESV